MPHSIRDLVSKVPEVNTGNRYKVELFLPDALKAWSANLDKIQFYCKECTLPANGVTQIENRVYGQKRMLGSFKESGTTNISFLFDYKGFNVKLFNAWLDYIVKPDTKRLEYYANYIGRVRITLLNNLNKTIYVCNLEEAYPLKVNEISLSYNQNDILPLEIEWWYRTRNYTQDRDDESIIESPIKEGTTQLGDLVNSQIDQVTEIVTDVINTTNQVRDAVERVRSIGRVFDRIF